MYNKSIHPALHHAKLFNIAELSGTWRAGEGDGPRMPRVITQHARILTLPSKMQLIYLMLPLSVRLCNTLLPSIYRLTCFTCNGCAINMATVDRNNLSARWNIKSSRSDQSSFCRTN